MSAIRKNVLFVCTGNLCRSPMAEYLFRNKLGETAEGRAQSAGLCAQPGLPASEAARAVLVEKGVDASAHRSQPVNRELIDWADYVLVMTHSHRENLLAQWPFATGKVHLLTSFGVEAAERDIEDPIGNTRETYRRVRDRLDAAIADVIIYLAEDARETRRRDKRRDG